MVWSWSTSSKVIDFNHSTVPRLSNIIIDIFCQYWGPRHSFISELFYTNNQLFDLDRLRLASSYIPTLRVEGPQTILVALFLILLTPSDNLIFVKMFGFATRHYFDSCFVFFLLYSLNVQYKNLNMELAKKTNTL